MNHEKLCAVLDAHKDELGEGWTNNGDRHCILGWCLVDAGFTDDLAELESAADIWHMSHLNLEEDIDVHQWEFDREKLNKTAFQILTEVYGLTQSEVNEIMIVNDKSHDLMRHHDLHNFFTCSEVS